MTRTIYARFTPAERYEIGAEPLWAALGAMLRPEWRPGGANAPVVIPPALADALFYALEDYVCGRGESNLHDQLGLPKPSELQELFVSGERLERRARVASLVESLHAQGYQLTCPSHSPQETAFDLAGKRLGISPSTARAIYYGKR